ncbi:acyltransferase family protein [Glaciecola petra]|uniref:Acyltransferase n=1 Tax=Glaciecola petra TaxID=3075602 RepID=A0ABU2ZQQ8_9ALTE|nr:acyltransferase [Aestuariibacter sp. P117]MDT0594962.1 acyltransferase [Aestuariibacter sp. P117]
MNPSERIYYLDLLRAIAILLVFNGHTILSYGATEFSSGFQFGGTGVDLFFLLSGWLIGSQLFSEHHKFGNIDIRKFWVRRWLRTMPAYFTVLLLTLLQLYLTKDNVASPLPYFTFTQNYSDLPYFYVSWSLAVEEQFYFVIAPLTALLLFFKRPWFALLALVLFLLLPSLFRFLEMYTSLNQTHVRWDCCLMGVLLAYMQKQYRQTWDRFAKYKTVICTVCAGLYISFFLFRWFPPVENYVDPSTLVLALVFGGFVYTAVNSPITRLPFAHRLIMHISTRSYSIYLLHPDVLAICKRLIPDAPMAVYYLVAFSLTLLVAEGLYRIVEIPFINIRERYAISQRRRLEKS